MTSTLKTIATFLFLLSGLTTYAQKTYRNVYEAIVNPDSFEVLLVGCPHDFPNANPCDSIPEKINKLKNLRIFSGSESRFCCLPETFNQLYNLEAFSLGENQNFQTYELCKLVGLPKLKTLRLSFMGISEFPVCIGKIQSLEKLWLNLYGFNYPQAIRVLSELPNLKSICISLEENQSFPNNIQNLENLLYLRLDYSFVDIDSLVKYCAPMGLQGLGLAEIGLNTLSKDFWKMKGLIGLDLSGNSFDSIPNEILKLKNLRFLSLQNNSPHSDFFLGDEISNLDQIEYLDLSDTKFNLLPEGITELKNLKFLNIHRSKVQNLTTIIPRMKELKQLNIDLNKSNIEDIENLRTICPDLIITDLLLVQLDNSDILGELMTN